MEKRLSLISRISYLHIFLFALVLRAAYFLQASHCNELFDYPIADAHVYVSWAQQIAAGNMVWWEPSNYTPMYPLYLAAWFFLFGPRPEIIFLAFHVLGALQAVAIGKMAEIVWSRRIGLVSAFLAASYWPFILFEATFYAENFAVLTLSLCFLCFAIYTDRGRLPWLLGAGLFVGLSSLVRANMLVCLPAMALWIIWDLASKRTDSAAISTGGALKTVVYRLLLFLLPALLLSVPIAAWNWRIAGTPILRTQAGSCLYMGNNPDYGGLIVPLGTEWKNLIREPLLAGKTLVAEKEKYWIHRTVQTIRTRPGEWLVLQAKKLLMSIGAFEISQEIDIYRFKKMSGLLRLPIWPGFAFLGSTAAVGLLLSLLQRQRKPGFLTIFAVAYFVALFPFQVASRFRLPLVVALLPFSGYYVLSFVEYLRERNCRKLFLLVAAGLFAALVITPDHTELRSRNVVKHWFFIGMKRHAQHDMKGAMNAFIQAMVEDPDDPDPLLPMGTINLRSGSVEKAKACFVESYCREPRNPEALLGLAQCAIAEKRLDDALGLVSEALLHWPNSLKALHILYGLHVARNDWEMARLALEQMHSYVNCPTSVIFLQAAVAERIGDCDEVIRLYDEIVEKPSSSSFDRDKAAFFAGATCWRYRRDRGAAQDRWNRIGQHGRTFWGPIGDYLTRKLPEKQMIAAYSESDRETGGDYMTYALGIVAWMRGESLTAESCFDQLCSKMSVGHGEDAEENVLARWATLDLAVLGREETMKQHPSRALLPDESGSVVGPVGLEPTTNGL